MYFFAWRFYLDSLISPSHIKLSFRSLNNFPIVTDRSCASFFLKIHHLSSFNLFHRNWWGIYRKNIWFIFHILFGYIWFIFDFAAIGILNFLCAKTSHSLRAHNFGSQEVCSGFRGFWFIIRLRGYSSPGFCFLYGMLIPCFCQHPDKRFSIKGLIHVILNPVILDRMQ